jgi:hypothetical protein
MHHEGWDKGRNYDVVVIDPTSGTWTPPTPHLGQVKLPCQNFCNGEKGRPTGIRTRAGYLPYIAIISGHCDILAGHGANEMTAWLIDEAEGKASPEVVETLDNHTINLLGILIDPEPWRMGTLKP